MSFGGIQSHPGRACILLLPLFMTGCFQLDTIDHTVTTPPTPPIIRYESLHPAIDKVVTFNTDNETASFYLPDIFDANGYEEERLYARWFVNYDPISTSAPGVFGPIDRIEAEETDDCICPGCCWSTQFTVQASDFGEGEGCYQILALVSDSDFKDVRGQLHETVNENTIPARAIWWVWVYSGVDPVPPEFDTCADLAEAGP